MDYGQIIYRTADDSYVITKDGMPYHVYPCAAEFAGEWDAVFAYADRVERVLATADAFAGASGSIIGQRKALEDRLDACTTLEEVQGITVNISMPGGGEA